MATIDPQPNVVSFSEDVLDRMELAIQRVQVRQRRTTLLLEEAGISYALSGSNATYAWIESVDPSTVRYYRNVEILVNAPDANEASNTFDRAGFHRVEQNGPIRFSDRPNENWRTTDEFTLGGESVVGKCPHYKTPTTDEAVILQGQRVLNLPSLVRFQLARYRLDDAVDLRDMIDVGLIDQSWTNRLPADLASRLQELLDTPDG